MLLWRVIVILLLPKSNNRFEEPVSLSVSGMFIMLHGILFCR